MLIIMTFVKYKNLHDTRQGREVSIHFDNSTGLLYVIRRSSDQCFLTAKKRRYQCRQAGHHAMMSIQ